MPANQVQCIAPDGKAILSRLIGLLAESLKASNHGVGSNPKGETNNPEKKQGGNRDAHSR